jgi:L-pipecolate oxidase
VFGRELARHVAGEVPLEEMFLPVTVARSAPFRAVREGYYELGAQIAHLPPAW